MAQPRLADADVAALKARFTAGVESLAPQLAPAARALLLRISLPNWTLEWSLPRWIGEAIGLPAETCADLALANVFGLGFVRLQDDLADAEVPAAEQPAALLLSTTLYQRWISCYLRLFDRQPAFWPIFERDLTQWVRATGDSRTPFTQPFSRWGDAEFQRLGERGAPLKIGAAGACLLAERAELIPRLEKALDHLLIGAVLLDHAQDWPHDLDAGRHNAFVAFASPLPQTPERGEENRRAVLQELMLGQGARPYFALLQTEFRAAIGAARDAGIPALCDYITWLHNQAGAYGKRLAREAQAQLHGLAEGVLGVGLALTG